MAALAASAASTVVKVEASVETLEKEIVLALEMVPLAVSCVHVGHGRADDDHADDDHADYDNAYYGDVDGASVRTASLSGPDQGPLSYQHCL